MSVQTIYSGLRKTAVLAIILHPHTWLEDKPIRKGRGDGLYKDAVVYHINQCWRLFSGRVVSCCTYHNLFYGKISLFQQAGCGGYNVPMRRFACQCLCPLAILLYKADALLFWHLLHVPIWLCRFWFGYMPNCSPIVRE